MGKRNIEVEVDEIDVVASDPRLELEVRSQATAISRDLQQTHDPQRRSELKKMLINTTTLLRHVDRAQSGRNS